MPDENNNNHDENLNNPDENNLTDAEMHTAHEAELTQQIAQLNQTIKDLQEQNRKMFNRLAGQDNPEPEKSLSDQIDEMIMQHLHAKDYDKE